MSNVPCCKKVYEPFKEFVTKIKEAHPIDFVLVNCDKRENDYVAQLKDLSEILALPYNAPAEIIAQVEDVSEAKTVPRVSVFSVEKGFSKPVV